MRPAEQLSGPLFLVNYSTLTLATVTKIPEPGPWKCGKLKYDQSKEVVSSLLTVLFLVLIDTY